MAAPYSAKAVANYFLGLASKEGRPLSPMKLQKLIYFAHGWCLAIYGRPLISEQVQAWKYGPVIESIYHEFKQFGAGKIQGMATSINAKTLDFLTPIIDPDDKETIELLNTVWQLYGKFSAIQLSNITHQEGTPWEVTWRKHDGMMSVAIDNSDIRDFFVSKVKKNDAASAAG